jgi:hypothetical protein
MVSLSSTHRELERHLRRQRRGPGHDCKAVTVALELLAADCWPHSGVRALVELVKLYVV